MKTKHNLSGIYFRQQNKDTNKWENVCFEDLEESEQRRLLENANQQWLTSLCIQLANVLHKVADDCDISRD